MGVSDRELLYRIALTMVPGVGSVLAKTLLSYCGSPEAVFMEKRSVLNKIPDLGSRATAGISAKGIFQNAEKELKFVRDENIKVLFFSDDIYPHRLKYCYDAPILLYARGDIDINEGHAISIVGSRAATDYGKSFCDSFVQGLQSIGGIIVSGLAYGIDIAAHRAALNHSMKTVAVLGHGLDRIYPPLHSKTAVEISHSGMLISEFPSGTLPDKENFPKRNRIIAGLADATIVVEAGMKGGALITANIADSYNRDVFAVPGRTNDPMSRGTNFLIKSNRAVMIENHEDLIKHMMWDVIEAEKARGVQVTMFAELSDEEKTLVSLLKDRKQLHIDQIALLSGIKVSKAAAVLLELEFKGLLSALPGKQFKII